MRRRSSVEISRLSIGGLIAVSLLGATRLGHAQEASAELRDNGLDYSILARARTYSEDAAPTARVGYGYRLWGEGRSPFVGYIHPNVSGVFNLERYGARPELELFPVAPLSLFVGRTWLHDFKNAPTQNCALGRCQGDLSSTDVGVKVVLDGRRLFLNARYSVIFYDGAKDKSQQLLDSINAVLLSPDGEVSQQIDAVAGIRADSWLSAGAWAQGTFAHKSGARQNAEYIFGNVHWNAFSLSVAAGRFKSDLKSGGGSLVAALSWGSAPDLGLIRPAF